MRMHVGISCFAAILVFAVMLGASSAQAAVRWVPSAAHPTIQDAVDDSDPGDWVFVFFGGGSGDNGEYKENVVIDRRIRLICPPLLSGDRAVIDVSDTVTTRPANETVANSVGKDYSAGITVEGEAAGTLIVGCTVQFAQDCNAFTDPSCSNNDDAGNGIDIDVPRVGLRNVRVHGCQNDGVDISGEGDGFRVLNSISNANGGAGFKIGDINGIYTPGTDSIIGAADNGLIRSSVAVGNGNGDSGERQGIKLHGNNCRVAGNRTDQNDDSGTWVWGDGNTVDGNTALVNNGNGFYVMGSLNTITGNTAEVTQEGPCFLIEGNDLLIEGNSAQGCARDCFRAGNVDGKMTLNTIGYGFGMTVRNNDAMDCGDDGFELDCNKEGDECGVLSDPLSPVINPNGGECGDITGNTAVRAGNEAFDLDCFHDNLIANNRAEMAENQGFRLHYLNAVTFSGNTAVRNGRAGIRSSDGYGNSFLRNTATNNKGDGIRFVNDGSDATIDNNTSSRNWQDGIDLNRPGSTGNAINGNTVLNNLGTGIENDAADTDITNNTAIGNRTDIAGEGGRTDVSGSVDAFSGNTFNTGGATTSTPATGWQDRGAGDGP